MIALLLIPYLGSGLHLENIVTFIGMRAHRIFGIDKNQRNYQERFSLRLIETQVDSSGDECIPATIGITSPDMTCEMRRVSSPAGMKLQLALSSRSTRFRPGIGTSQIGSHVNVSLGTLFVIDGHL